MLHNLVIWSDTLMSALKERFLKLIFPRGKSGSFTFLSVLCIFSCVCVYTPFTVKASSVCNDVRDIYDWTDQRSCVVSIILSAFAKILHLCFWNYYISHPKRKLQQANKLERKWYDLCTGEKMIYIDIGYQPASGQNGQLMKKY